MTENDDPPPLNATSLLRIVVGMLASEYPSRVQAESLINRLALQGGSLQINVIQGLVNLIRALPMYVFRTDEDRLAIIAALREVLDAAVEDEENLADADVGDVDSLATMPTHPTLQ